MPRRYFHRSDENQSEMVHTLRKLGIKVHVWGEQADLICQFGGMTVLCEVRPDGKPKEARKGRQKAFQQTFMVKWIQTQDDCIALAKTLKAWQMAVMQTHPELL